MSNAQELANECADLGDLAGKVFQVDSPEYETASATGRVRYAVEIECAKRNIDIEYCLHNADPVEWRHVLSLDTPDHGYITLHSDTALEVVLLALKWLLEHPETAE